MSKRLGTLVILVAAIAAVTASVFASTSRSSAKTRLTIGLVGSDAPLIESGAQSAAAALGDQLVIPGGHAKAAIFSLIAQHVDAIAVGPGGANRDDGDFVPALAEARTAGIQTLSFAQPHPGSVWINQSSVAAQMARALADALASQMKDHGQFAIVACHRADPVVASLLDEAKSYLPRRYPRMLRAAVVFSGVEHPPWRGPGPTVGPVLRAHPHLRGLLFLCGGAATGQLIDAHKVGKVFSVGVGRWCPPLNVADAGDILSGATELVCEADWTRLGYLTIWAADHLATGNRLVPARYHVGGPVGTVLFYKPNEELRLLVPPLTVTKANARQYASVSR
jgi:ABC-type sugar transport system substrate-binding protein